MITIKKGNLFDSKCETLVNTVNCVGVMGKGIALAFKSKFPKMYKAYRDDCAQKKIKIGKLYPYYEDGKLKVLNFPTKDHWRFNSKLSYVQQGLVYFVNNYDKIGIKSIAFPPLGCGNGGLNWDIVGPMMYFYLEKLPIEIEIYLPFEMKINSDDNSALEKEESKLIIRSLQYKNYSNAIVEDLKRIKNKNSNLLFNKTFMQNLFYLISFQQKEFNFDFKLTQYGIYSPLVEDILDFLTINGYLERENAGKSIVFNPVKDQSKNTEKFSTNEFNTTDEVIKLFGSFRNNAEFYKYVKYLYLCEFEDFKESLGYERINSEFKKLFNDQLTGDEFNEFTNIGDFKNRFLNN